MFILDTCGVNNYKIINNKIILLKNNYITNKVILLVQ